MLGALLGAAMVACAFEPGCPDTVPSLGERVESTCTIRHPRPRIVQERCTLLAIESDDSCGLHERFLCGGIPRSDVVVSWDGSTGFALVRWEDGCEDRYLLEPD